jgi:hypothetical protein
MTDATNPTVGGETVSKEEFCERFKARMLLLAGQPEFDDGGSIAEYADMAALTYWDDPDQRREGPEECAAADVSYWGDE